MSLKNKLALVSCLVVAASCGKPTSKKDETRQDVVEAAAPVAKPADMPVAAIVRVPVDAEGKEDPTQAELRLEASEKLAKTKEEALASFENGKAPAQVKKSHDELDKDSSSQSWFFGSLFRNYNYGYNYGYNYSIGYGSYNNYYSYGYGNHYNYGNYNYYYYPYSGYGYGGGYGGGYGRGYY